MSNNEKLILKVIKSVVQSNFKNKVTLDSLLKDELNIDSIKLLNIAFNLQLETGLNVMALSEEIDFTEIRTGNDLLKILNDYVK